MKIIKYWYWFLFVFALCSAFFAGRFSAVPVKDPSIEEFLKLLDVHFNSGTLQDVPFFEEQLTEVQRYSNSRAMGRQSHRKAFASMTLLYSLLNYRHWATPDEWHQTLTDHIDWLRYYQQEMEEYETKCPQASVDGWLYPLYEDIHAGFLFRLRLSYQDSEKEQQLAFREMRHFSFPFYESEIPPSLSRNDEGKPPEFIQFKHGFYENIDLYEAGFSLQYVLLPEFCIRYLDSEKNIIHRGIVSAEFALEKILFEVKWKNGVFDSKKQLSPPEQP